MIIIELGLRIIWRIMEISEAVICQGWFNILPDLPNSSKWYSASSNNC